MDPLRGIGSAERKRSGEHLVERDTQGVEITPEIDPPVHAASLLGRHISECPGNHLGRRGCLSLARKTGSNAETCHPDFASRRAYKNIGGLDILVNETSFVELAERSRYAGGQAEESRQFQRPA